MKKPKVAILMATRNGGGFLQEQLDSLLEQTYKNIEIYVSDDGSTDETPGILAEYAKKSKNVKIVKSAKRLGGACQNFMFLMNSKEVREAKADFYMFSDQDDVWLETKVEKMLKKYDEALRKGSDGMLRRKPTLIYCDMKVVDAELKVLQESFQEPMKKFRKDWQYYVQNNNISGCAMMMDAALMELYRRGRFDASKIYMHDHLVAMLAALCGEIVYVDEPLQLYRQHSSNTLGAKNKESGDFMTRLRKKPVKKAAVRAGRILEEILKSSEQEIENAKLAILKKYMRVYKRSLARVRFVVHHKLFYDDDKTRWIIDNLLF